MSIRSLAAAVRAAPGSLTYHYGDKETLLARCAGNLGDWLCRDVEERLVAGGLTGVLPDPASDEPGELEYCCRLRVWAQLRAYGLHSGAVGGVVDAGDRQMRLLLSSTLDELGRSGLTALALWAVASSLTTALLLPAGDLTRAQATAALMQMREPVGRP